MPLAVVQDETPNPLNVLRFRADAVMLGANPLAHLVEQFWRLRRRCVCRPHLPPFSRPACAETTRYRTAEGDIHLFGRSIYTCLGAYFTLGKKSMSLQRWTEEDTLALIEWSANESVIAIKEGKYSYAEKLHRGVAAIIGIGQMATTNDSRLNKWLDFRLSQISYPLRDNRLPILNTDRSHILESLTLLTEFFENQPEIWKLGDRIVLPEPFDEGSVFW